MDTSKTGGEKMIDFTLYDGGSVFLLTPRSDEAKDWVKENLPDDVLILGQGIAVENRYIRDIMDGLTSEGLTIRSTEA